MPLFVIEGTVKLKGSKADDEDSTYGIGTEIEAEDIGSATDACQQSLEMAYELLDGEGDTIG